MSTELATPAGGALRPGGTLLAAEHLRVTFRIAHGGHLLAVDDVSLSVASGQMLGVVGESGSGKTTVARCLVGLQASDAGTITLGGDILSGRRSAAERRAVQLVFQDPFASLNPRLRIATVLRELLAYHGLARGEAAEARCRQLMEVVGLDADALARYPSAFSGGQRQRLAIARALAVEPAILVADEAVSSLDVSVQATILALFADLRDRLGLGIVMISHNLAAVRHVCDQVAVMYLGKVVEIGSRDEIFADPRHPYTVALLAAAPRVRPGAARVTAKLAGEPPSPTARPSGCEFHPRCPRAEPICAVEAPALLAVGPGSSQLAACHFRHEHRREDQGREDHRREEPR
jgi:oligopeptide/dipeptide ABC transporter ATP-binding protein